MVKTTEQGFPLVSVTIPTMNSANTIEQCLSSIAAQTYQKVEIIIMDGGSYDGTVELARRYGARVCSGAHLAQRRLLGVRISHGEMILMLDSDQVLSPDAIEKCVRLCGTGEFDALFIPESPLSTNSIVQKALSLDRRLVHKLRDTHPVFGTLLPRFFRADFIRTVSWPTQVMANDHAYIYYACWKAGARMAISDARVFHHEPQSFSAFARKSYRWGYYYASEIRINPAIAVTHAFPRRVYFSREGLGNRWILAVFLLYTVKIIAAGSGGLLSIGEAANERIKRYFSWREYFS